ncbi:RNA polymerase sigma factor [Actinomadura madurae]|uniref:RNA polymerase sigma factor n=1 Tax=Actinomadura madurae TaxID=1993 RepID=UPI0020D241F8|nr:sigma-70 family RNA polymerase sigma factor [Actinomadura madurae]MCP9948080.1 sigma-70 family RNA polymerase sigma factor [Actinomadura madurae]MCP9964846.1 sigma-70 family RNA polymerase sigma factor [Actinomadura madurae]MCP9977336.1 sigma-70 family RNA polymerase sigma factor [Actinomadura madurae]MCQ0011156.1 sigma-70 family RNA polymerase sigma factor [Actinomadura madurae]MCQ0013519.1 sigma-70 family RNA polymerase sigma factor [Actinomadura madurae]
MTLGTRLAQGDETALDECYTTLAPLVRRHVLRLVPGHAVDDVVQLVFLELWRTRRRFDPARELEPWVLAIARKRAIDQLRAEARHHRRWAPLEDVGEPDATPAVDAACDVRKAMAALPLLQRQAIVLAHFGQLTQREIADRLCVPLGTVKARTARGLHRMRELL